MPNTTRTRRQSAAFLVALGLFASHPAVAQSDAASVWRATSRLGYGPTAATALAAQTDAKAWALQQIDLARAASLQAPLVPLTIARFNQPLSDTIRDYQAEREARRSARQLTANAPPAGTDVPANAAIAVEAINFSRDMQQQHLQRRQCGVQASLRRWH